MVGPDLLERGLCRVEYTQLRTRDASFKWATILATVATRALRLTHLARETPDAPATSEFSTYELQAILGDRDPIRRGGYKVYTTLDMKAQKLGERLITGGAVLPNLPLVQFYKQLNELHLRGNAGWINRLRGSSLHNGALVAEDYRTGDILAYVGSAGYYRKGSPRMAPQVDHIGGSWRQPGSAWKPILYASGIDTGKLTAGTYLLDQQETFSPGWTPRNADGTYRGLVTVRQAIQQSLNIPAIRALQRTGITTVRRYAQRAGFVRRVLQATPVDDQK